MYTDMIKTLLDSNKLTSEDVCFKLSSDEGYAKCVTQGLIIPIRDLKKQKGRIYHATDELCCIGYPFFKGKKITTFHHIPKKTVKDGYSPLLYRVWKAAAKNAIKYSDAIISVSEQTKDELVEFMGADPNKIFVLEHRADSFFQDLGRPRKKLIGYVGTLIERKNVESGVLAFKSFIEMQDAGDYNLVICGEGPLKEDLNKLADSLDISDKVSFISNISKTELRDLYNDMAVFINPSFHEGLGLTAMEAQACGTPVVYFRDAEIPPEVSKGYVPSDDVEDFAKNIHRLVTDTDFRNKFKIVPKSGLSDEENAKKLFEIYSVVSGEEFP